MPTFSRDFEFPSSKFIQTRCMVNRTTEVFYWFPPVQNCFSTKNSDTPYFYGSIYALRQLQHAFQAGKAAAVAVKEKPLVSLSVGMSALSVVLVLIMLLGICHRNAPETANQRQRQAAARRRARTRGPLQHENHASIGTQAEVEPSDMPFVLHRSSSLSSSSSSARRAAASGVNAGFQDSEALLSRHQDLTQPTPAAMTFVEENEGENANDMGVGESVSRLSCLAIPHRDSPPTEYRPTPHPPKIFKGVPALPTYEDATKRGMYCIIRESDITAPPAYQYRVPDDGDDDEASPLSGGASHEAAVFASISSWDFDAYGVHRGSVNSMPEFSSIFGPPDSPYPGDSPQ